MRIVTFVVFSLFLLSLYLEDVKCTVEKDSLESQRKNEAIERKLKEAIEDILITYQKPKDLKLKSTFTLSIALPPGVEENYITDVVVKTFENILSETFASSRTGSPLSIVNFRLETHKNEKDKNEGVRKQNILVTFGVPNIDSNGECVTSDSYKNDTWCSEPIKWSFEPDMKDTRMKHIQRVDKGFSFDYNNPLWAHLRSWMKKEISSQEKPHSKQVSLSLIVTGRPYSTYEEWLIMTMHIDDQIRPIESKRDIKYLAQPTQLNSKIKTFTLKILITPTNQILHKELHQLKSICENEMIPQFKKHYSNLNLKFISMFNAIDTTRQKVTENSVKIVLRIFERGSKLKLDKTEVNQIFKDIKKKHQNIHFISYYRQSDMKNSDLEYLILSFALSKSENNQKENISKTTPKPETTSKGSYGTTTISTTHNKEYNSTTSKTLNTTEEAIYTTEKDAYTNTNTVLSNNTTDMSTIATDETINSNRNEESTHTYTSTTPYDNTTDKGIDTASSTGTTYTVTHEEGTYATEMAIYNSTTPYDHTTDKGIDTASSNGTTYTVTPEEGTYATEMTTYANTANIITYENTTDKATDTVTDTTPMSTYSKSTDEGAYTYTTEMSTYTNTTDMNTFENTTDVGTNTATFTNTVDMNIYTTTTDMTSQDSSRADHITTVDFNNGNQGSTYTISLIETAETITTDEVTTDTPISNNNNDTNTESSAASSDTKEASTESSKEGKEFIKEVMEQEILPIVNSIYPSSRTNFKISQVEDNTTSLCKLDIFDIEIGVVVNGKLDFVKGKTIKKTVDDSLEKHTNIIVTCVVYSDKNYVYSTIQMMLRMKIAKPFQTCYVPKELKEKACLDSKHIIVLSPATEKNLIEDNLAIDGENLPLSEEELPESKETVFEGVEPPSSEELIVPGGEPPSPKDQLVEELYGGNPPLAEHVQVIAGGKPPGKSLVAVIKGGVPPLKAKSAGMIPGGRPPLKKTKKHVK